MKSRRTSAFSLIEIMVSITLLALIVAGLLVVFNYTSRALRMANNSTDVLEGARSTVQFVAQDFAAMTASRLSNTANFFAVAPTWPPRVVTLPDNTVRSNVLHDVFFIINENDRWAGIGYFLQAAKFGEAVGTLYRFDVETNGPVPGTNWLTLFSAARVGDTNVHRIADGVVKFQVTPFDAKGRIYLTPTRTNDLVVVNNGLSFQNRFLPAHVELEIGLMEPETTRKFYAIDSANSAAALTFLTEQAGKIHLFRRRVAIRNHSEPPPFD